MRLFLQVKIGSWQESNDDQSLQHFASSLSSDLIGTHMDTESDSTVTGLVIKLIEQVDRVFLLVVVNDPKVELGNASKVITHLLNHDAVTVAFWGTHIGANELLSGFGQNLTRVNKEGEVKALIAEFAQ